MQLLDLTLKDLKHIQNLQFSNTDEETIIHQLEKTFMIKKDTMDIETLFSAL